MLDQICSKRIFPFKNRKCQHHHRIPHIQIIPGTKFHINRKFWILGSNLPRKVFSVKRGKSEHYHYQVCSKTVFSVKNRKNKHSQWILNIWISLGINISLNWLLLTEDLLKKSISNCKQKKTTWALKSAYSN